MRLLLSFLLVLSLCVIDLSAQENEFKNKISEEEHPRFPDARAAYLKYDSEVKYSVPRNEAPTLYITKHQRIEIYNKDGLDMADFDLYAYKTGGNSEYIYNIEATVFNYENGKISKSVLKEENIYKKEVSSNYNSVKFALPNVQVGSIIDIKYTKSSPFIYTIPRHYFQHDIPVEESEFKVRLPQKMSFTPIVSGNSLWEQSSKVDNLADPPVTIFSMNAKDIEPILEDKYVLNINDYRAGLKYEMKTYQYNDGRKVDFSASWNEIASELNSRDDFGRQIKNKLKPLKSFVKEVKIMEQEARIQYVYDYVRENYSWNGNYGKLTERGMKNLMKDKTGNVADVNLLMINLLKKVGIEASPLILKSRWNGILNTRYPNISEPNYVLAYVKINGENLLIDATSKVTPLGQLPLRAINTTGIIIGEKIGKPIDLENPNLYKSKNLLSLEIDTVDHKLHGTNEGVYFEYAATIARMKSVDKIDGGDTQSSDENDLDNFEFINIENLEDLYKPLVFERKEVLENAVAGIDGKLFLNAFIIDQFETNPFTLYKRQHPVFFNTTYDIRKVYKVKIPDNYKVDFLPESLSVKLPPNEGVIIYDAKVIGDEIIINFNIKLTQLVFDAYEYPRLREFYKKIFAKQDEKIVLSRI